MKVLVVDPDPESRDALRQAFSGAGNQVRSVSTLAEGHKQLAEYLPEIVVAALALPDGEGRGFLDEALQADPQRVTWALVGGEGLEEAAQLTHDFLWRPVSPARVSQLLARFSESCREQEVREQIRLRLARAEASSSLPGRSRQWRAALAAIEREAASDEPVLLTGEAGTEKEAAARALHLLSRRGSEPLVLAPEGEGFTSAARKAGRGTLFVPGVDRAPASVQAALLLAVEEERGPRLVVGTDLKPQDAAGEGKILPELARRLKDSAIHLPPLRERGSDVLLLARDFLEDYGSELYFEAEAMEALAAHDWPGNVRELQEVVRRASQLAEGPSIGPTVVRSVLGRPLAGKRSRRRRVPVVTIAVGDSLAEVERRLIQKTLEFARGNKRKTAELLKLSLKTIYNKIKEYGLETGRRREADR